MAARRDRAGVRSAVSTIVSGGGVQQVQAGGVAIDTHLVSGGEQEVFGSAISTRIGGGTSPAPLRERSRAVALPATRRW